MRTPQDIDLENRNLRGRLAEYESERKWLQDQFHQRNHAVDQLRHAISEAIAFTGRWGDMANIDEGMFRPMFKKRAEEAKRLHSFFIIAKSRFEDILNGTDILGKPERFVQDDASAGTDAGEGKVAGSTEQEQQGDSGQAVAGVDNPASEEKQSPV